jgi:hypothetical protein
MSKEKEPRPEIEERKTDEMLKLEDKWKNVYAGMGDKINRLAV